MRNRNFWGYKCVSVQNSTWILSHQLTVSIALRRRRLSESASFVAYDDAAKWIMHAGILWEGSIHFTTWISSTWLVEWPKQRSRHGNRLSSRLSSRGWVAEVERKRKCVSDSVHCIWVELEYHWWLFNLGNVYMLCCLLIANNSELRCCKVTCRGITGRLTMQIYPDLPEVPIF